MSYHAAFELGAVALNVKNLDLQRRFYEQVLGLTLLEQTASTALLGTAERPLVELRQTADQTEVKRAYGLYHFALLLPTRRDLGNLFKHLIDNEVPLVGASDHGYSEAIYLEDTEGNGIEVYRDRPESDWDIREDGRIVGITEPMDAQGVYDAADSGNEHFQLAPGTIMGHIHLSVSYSQQSSLFYQDTLGVSDKFSVPTGAWLASGTYHHHLAVNEWGGHHLQKREEQMAGLAYYTVIYSNKEGYEQQLQQLEAAGLSVDASDSQVSFLDQDGIRTKILLQER